MKKKKYFVCVYVYSKSFYSAQCGSCRGHCSTRVYEQLVRGNKGEGLTTKRRRHEGKLRSRFFNYTRVTNTKAVAPATSAEEGHHPRARAGCSHTQIPGQAPGPARVALGEPDSPFMLDGGG